MRKSSEGENLYLILVLMRLKCLTLLTAHPAWWGSSSTASSHVLFIKHANIPPQILRKQIQPLDHQITCAVIAQTFWFCIRNTFGIFCSLVNSSDTWLRFRSFCRILNTREANYSTKKRRQNAVHSSAKLFKFTNIDGIFSQLTDSLPVYIEQSKALTEEKTNLNVNVVYISVIGWSIVADASKKLVRAFCKLCNLRMMFQFWKDFMNEKPGVDDTVLWRDICLMLGKLFSEVGIIGCRKAFDYSKTFAWLSAKTRLTALQKQLIRVLIASSRGLSGRTQRLTAKWYLLLNYSSERSDFQRIISFARNGAWV